MENKLLLSINFIPETSHNCLKKRVRSYVFEVAWFICFFQPTVPLASVVVFSHDQSVRLRLLMDEDAIQKLAIGAYRCQFQKGAKKQLKRYKSHDFSGRSSQGR